MPYGASPAAISVNPADQAAVTNASYRATGLGAAAAAWTLTPQVTGRVFIMVTGFITGSGAGTATLQLIFGTGSAPANAASSGLGTAVGGQPAYILDAGGLQTAFSLCWLVTGLAVPSVDSTGKTQAATPVWFDLQQKMTANSLQVQAANCIAIEL